jgi:opacity protein-like surface antigen
MRYKYSYAASGMGYYGKFGAIITPGYGLRIGAAIQTPTINTINEGWQQSGETSYTDRSYDAEAQSPYGQGSYRMVSPLRANFGLAYALGQVGVISADYEVCDYSQMRYKASEYDRDYFEGVNEDIRAGFKASHSLRIGAEFKPMPELAVRAGYNLGTQAQKKYYDANLGDYLDIEPTYTQNLSFGVGYSSRKSFFADLACRYTFRTNEFIYPYSDYLKDYGTLSPEILNRHSNWKLLLTLGWRF